MQNPPKKEKPKEIANAYLAARDGRFVKRRALAALMREAGLGEREEEASSDDEREEGSSSNKNEDRSSDDESSAARPMASTPAAARGGTGRREPVESKEEASSPSLTELAKKQLAAAEKAHEKKGNKGTLQAPTMGVGRYRTIDSRKRVRFARKTSNQRNLPGTDEQARLESAHHTHRLCARSWPNLRVSNRLASRVWTHSRLENRPMDQPMSRQRARRFSVRPAQSPPDAKTCMPSHRQGHDRRADASHPAGRGCRRSCIGTLSSYSSEMSLFV
jgi:hypothetical protein